MGFWECALVSGSRKSKFQVIRFLFNFVFDLPKIPVSDLRVTTLSEGALGCVVTSVGDAIIMGNVSVIGAELTVGVWAVLGGSDWMMCFRGE